jgi:gamma-glutamylcyclotransferase (GGCT)/AIG2-like uncharacterized protein YtfP
MNKQLVAVYGSLLSGLGNHGVISDGELVSTEVIMLPYQMISLGGFPGLVKSEDEHKALIEIYEVEADTYRSVEQLEGYPSFYDKALVNTSLGEVEIYVLNGEAYSRGMNLVEKIDGVFDWKSHYNNRN